MVKGVNECVLLILLLTATMSMLAFTIQPVMSDWTWTDPIYIRADGSVDPDTAPISSVDNTTYTFTDNIVGDIPENTPAIVVERDHIVVDGVGYTVQGTGRGKGIDLTGRSNITIKNAEIKVFYDGIWLNQSSNIIIQGNNITNNVDNGIRLYESSNNTTISRNIITNNNDGILLGLYQSSLFNNISGNTIMNNRNFGIQIGVSFNNGISGNNIMNNSKGIHLYESSNNTISGNNITENMGNGIYFYESSNNTVSGNNITECYSGIVLGSKHTANNTISGNKITNNFYGIRLFGALNNKLRKNDVSDNNRNFLVWGLYVHDIDDSNTADGKPVYYWINRQNMTVPLDGGWIALVNCTRITVKNLKLTNNSPGILLSYTTNSTIAENNITGNEYGILLHESSNNIFYHNDFGANYGQVRSYGSTNVWDDGYPSGGNYWGDYGGVDFWSGSYQNESGTDGFGDTPYVIDESNRDRYPLTVPFGQLVWDVDRNGSVGYEDIVIVVEHFGSCPGYPRWNTAYDINKDSYGGIDDIVSVAEHFGEEK